MKTSEQLRGARAVVGLTRGELAAEAGVSVDTVKRFEGGAGLITGRLPIVEALRGALEGYGITFTEGPEGEYGIGWGPGLRVSP
ncbi:MAG: helix-turn-helix transcriptional regulator [Pseudomonadota bacterium]